MGWGKDNIKYCGLEFGTTGIHQPFSEILKQKKFTVFNEETLRYLDAGDDVVSRYLSFQMESPVAFDEVESVYVQDRSLFIRHRKDGLAIELNSHLIEDLL